MNPGVRQNHQDACGGNEPVPARSDRITEGAGGGIAALVKVVSGREFASSPMGAGDRKRGIRASPGEGGPGSDPRRIPLSAPW
jgi:hypothetical protein